MLQSERGQREMKRELGNFRADVIRDVYRTERDIKRMVGEAAMHDPAKVLEEAEEAVNDTRMFEHAARELLDVGINADAAALQTFAQGVVGSVKTALTTPDELR